MKASYWDSLASSFDDEVFDPVAEDRNAVISGLVRQNACSGHNLIDIGCGNGRNIARFHNLFRQVKGIDISPACTRQARKLLADKENVSIACHDLVRPFPASQQYDLALCINVVLDPVYSRRKRLFKHLFSLIRPGGRLIMVVPSVESVLLTTHRMVSLNLRHFPNYSQAAAATNDQLGFTAKSLRDGIISKGGTPTKHYLKEELQLLFEESGQQVQHLSKVEYPWNTEIEDPAATMQAPFPWDWLVMSSAPA